MSHSTLEIRQWRCDYWLGRCTATAVTIGHVSDHGLPEGWVYTYADPDMKRIRHYCSEEHARADAADGVHPRRAMAAQPFNLERVQS